MAKLTVPVFYATGDLVDAGHLPRYDIALEFSANALYESPRLGEMYGVTHTVGLGLGIRLPATGTRGEATSTITVAGRENIAMLMHMCQTVLDAIDRDEVKAPDHVDRSPLPRLIDDRPD